jgi:general secretion pathway protein K
LPEMTPERFDIALGLRAGASQDVISAQLGTAGQFATVQAGKSNRVSVDIRFPDHRAHSEAVILLRDDDNEPYRILSWRDEGG